MKSIFLYINVTIVFILAIFGFVYCMRLFSNATTPITIYQPKSGVTCATMVTSDGAAISCWKD